MNRPTGVTILAVLYCISTCLFAFLGIASLVGMGFLSHMVAGKADMGGLAALLMAGAGIFLGIFFFFLALTYGFLAKAMLNLTSWARRLALVLSVSWMVFSGMTFSPALWRFSHLAFISSVIHLGVHIWIIWYLYQPHVQATFAIATAPTSAVTPPPAISRQFR